MIKTILQATGLQFWPTECSSPPPGAYALYFDDEDVDSSDGMEVMVVHHSATVELYAPTQEEADEACALLEAQLVAARRPWTKQPSYWLKDVQRFQVIYEFTYTEKRRT